MACPIWFPLTAAKRLTTPPMTPAPPEFPDHTAAERVVDALVHALGLAGASVAVSLLLAHSEPAATGGQLAALVVYGLGLLGMLFASALYNLTRAGGSKAMLQQLDHAMIFVMIAGSYTPFAVNALRPGLGVPLCVAVWLLAATGVGLRLMWERIFARISLGLYLGMGWLVLAVLPPLAAAVPGSVFVLLLLGGVVYSLGSLVHAQARVPFYNAAWHAMVVVAAALHLAAVAGLPP